MIPVIFCGQEYRDWPWWMFWKLGHRPHEYMGEQIGPNGPFKTLASCPGNDDYLGEG